MLVIGGASGFGPTIVDHPMNLTVGESGREFVSVIPIKGNGDRNLSIGEQLRKGADFGNVGSNSVRMATGTNNINDQYDYNSQSIINRDGIISQTQSHTGGGTWSQYQSNTGGIIGGGSNTGGTGGSGSTGGTVYNSNGPSARDMVTNRHAGFTPLVVNPYTRPQGNPNFARLPPGVSLYPGTIPNTGGDGGGSGNGNPPPPPPPPPPSGGGGGTGGSGWNLGNLAGLGEAINKMVHSIIEKAFSNTILNINNNNYIDGRKVYESNQRYFNLRSGALLK